MGTATFLDSYWRAIILFGRKAASFKFALGQRLLDLGSRGKTSISMEDAAKSFAKHLICHLELAPKQLSPSVWHVGGMWAFNEMSPMVL